MEGKREDPRSLLVAISETKRFIRLLSASGGVIHCRVPQIKEAVQIDGSGA